MDNPISGLMKTMETMKNALKETEKHVNTTEEEHMKELILKYDVILKDNIDEKDLILKYETFYDQLNEFVINKRKEIVDVEEMIKTLSGFSLDDNFNTIINKKKNNINKIIDCNNDIVEKIRVLETTVYYNRMKELDNMKTKRYEELKQVELQQPVKVDNNEMGIINNSMNLFKQWSNKNIFNILFDSDSEIDGDGSNNVLCNRVYKRSNLYFITSDTNNNVFGGYVSVEINNFNCRIKDNNAFIFSLIRDGKVEKTKYPIQSNYDAFFLFNDHYNWLYQFGNDILVKPIGDNTSWCQCGYYNYNDEKNPLIDNTTKYTKFKPKRIIVIQMN